LTPTRELNSELGLTHWMLPVGFAPSKEQPLYTAHAVHVLYPRTLAINLKIRLTPWTLLGLLPFFLSAAKSSILPGGKVIVRVRINGGLELALAFVVLRLRLQRQPEICMYA
jgi:hypothetical protein